MNSLWCKFKLKKSQHKKVIINYMVSCETVKCINGFDNRQAVLVLAHMTNNEYVRDIRGVLPASLRDVKVWNMTGLHRTHSAHFTSLPLIYHLLPVCSKNDHSIKFQNCGIWILRVARPPAQSLVTPIFQVALCRQDIAAQRFSYGQLQGDNININIYDTDVFI